MISLKVCIASLSCSLVLAGALTVNALSIVSREADISNGQKVAVENLKSAKQLLDSTIESYSSNRVSDIDWKDISAVYDKLDKYSYIEVTSVCGVDWDGTELEIVGSTPFVKIDLSTRRVSKSLSLLESLELPMLSLSVGESSISFVFTTGDSNTVAGGANG